MTGPSRRVRSSRRLPTIGFLGADALAWGPWTAAFVERLRELGWIEGRTIAIEYRWAEGRPERNAEIAAEFVRLKVDVIVTFGTAVPTVKRATTVIPIVFAVAQDPVGGGLVTNLARPGGNVTGLSIQATDVAAKRLQLLREIMPQLRRLAIMVDFNAPNPCWRWARFRPRLVRSALKLRHSQFTERRISHPPSMRSKPKADALYVVTNALINTNRTRIITLALNARLRQSLIPAILSKPEVSCPTDQTTWLSSGTPPSMSTKFCAGRSPAIFRSSNRPNSIWSST